MAKASGIPRRRATTILTARWPFDNTVSFRFAREMTPTLPDNRSGYELRLASHPMRPYSQAGLTKSVAWCE